MTTEYETTDLNAAAFLMSRGLSLLGAERADRGRCVFRFPAEAREEAMAFFRNAPVPARTFANALRDLKALVREV